MRFSSRDLGSVLLNANRFVSGFIDARYTLVYTKHSLSTLHLLCICAASWCSSLIFYKICALRTTYNKHGMYAFQLLPTILLFSMLFRVFDYEIRLK